MPAERRPARESAPRRRPILRRVVAAFVVACAVLSGSGASLAEDPVAVELTCNLKATVRRGGTATERLTWSGTVGDGTFSLAADGGPAISGTYRTKKRRVLWRLDPATLEALAAWTVQATPDVSAAIVRNHRVTLRAGATRDAKSLTARLRLRTTTSSGPRNALLTIVGDASPRRVLVLGDGAVPTEGSAPQVVAALRAAGHFVTDGGFYQEWEGSGLAEAETVVLLQGWEFADVMDEAADAALAAFVRAGGGLVRTEMAAATVMDSPWLEIDALLPVVSPAGETSTGTAWRFARPHHPLAKGLPRSFLVRNAGYTLVFPQDGAEVVAENPFSVPMITVSTAGAGRVVHVNHDLTFSAPTIQDEVLRVLVNAVEHTAP